MSVRVCLVQVGLDEEHEIDQWVYLCNSFGAELFVVGSFPKRKGVTAIQDVADLDAGDSLVVVQPAAGRRVQGASPLPDFTHPEDAVYVFGGSNYVMEPSDVGEYQHSVHIEGGELHAPLAGAIIFYDRGVKRG